MTEREYAGLPVEKRKLLFAAKLLPVDDAHRYWKEFLSPTSGGDGGENAYREFCEFAKCTFLLEDLRAVVREADKRGWWPGDKQLNEYLRKRPLAGWQSAVPDWIVDREKMTIVAAQQLLRAIVLGSVSEVAESLHGANYARNSFGEAPYVIAVSMAIDALDDEPQWEQVCQTPEGRHLILSWLQQAIFKGLKVQDAIACLRRILGQDCCSKSDALWFEQAYCSYCVWIGWREGLEDARFNGSGYAQGCRRLVAGDLAGAYKSQVAFADGGYCTEFATPLLVHAVCMAVKPSISRAVKIMGRFSSPCHSAEDNMRFRRVRKMCEVLSQQWTREWGRDGARIEDNYSHGGLCLERMDGVLRFAWDWHSKKEVDRVPLRADARRALAFIIQAVENGYVNIGGLFLALVPEMGEEPEARAVMEAMEKRGSWIMPYQASKPTWAQFVSALRGILGVESAKKTLKQSQGNEVCGRIVWELACDRAHGELVRLYGVSPSFRARKADGTEYGLPVRLQHLSAMKYRSCLDAQDLALCNILLTPVENGRRSFARGVSAEVVEALCGMSNLELVGDSCGETPVRTSIRIESRPCTMSSTVSEDGSVVLRLPAWRSCEGYALCRTERADVLAFMRIDESAQKLAAAFNAFGQEGKVMLPPETLSLNGDVLEKLGEVLPVEKTAVRTEEPLKEVRANSDCLIRLEFADGLLSIHVLSRPIKGNAELLFEPGMGPERRMVSGPNGPYELVRDLASERGKFAQIRSALADYDTWFNGRCAWLVGDVGEAIAALDRLREMEPKPVMEWDKEKTLRISRPMVKISSGAERRGWFDVKGTFTFDDGKVRDIVELLSAMRENGTAKNYVQLSSGDYIVLTKEIQKQLGALAEVGQAKNGVLQVARGALPFISSVFGGGGISLPTAMRNATKKVREALALNPEPPKMLAAQLRPYQLEGYRWLSRLAACGFGSCLADDMGLGKTLQTIALLLERAKDGASLVVAPASVCGNWRNEIRRFAPTLNPVVAMETKDGAIEKAGPRTVMIASYGYLLFHEKVFKAKSWNGLVLDEAQAIKNADAKRTKLVKEFNAEFRVAVTGTPVENRLEELWSIFDFLNAGLLGTREAFSGKGMASVRQIVKPLVLRRLKGDVLDDLPEKTEVTRFVELSVEERSAYEACRLKAQDDFAMADKKKRMGVLLAGLTRLRRFCCNPSLVLGKDAIGSAKLEALAELMEELREGGHRALVFSQFTDYLEIVRQMVQKKGWSAQYLDGETPLKERGKCVEAFQNGEGDFFLISLKAGGTGLNLTAADYVIILDPWWNPAVENQAADRAHRIGQRRPVTIYRLIAKDTVEERVLDLHREKLQLSAEILDDTASAKLTSEQLIGLLK